MATIIRTATLDDQAVLTDFGRRTFEETFASQNTPENMDAYLTAAFNAERQTEELADTNRVTLLAECDGVLLGYAQIHRSDVPGCVTAHNSVELVRFYVDTPVQGTGIAHELMRAIEDVARREASAIWLGVWEQNLRAIAFYRKCGFETAGAHTFRLGEDLQIDHIMVKVVSG
jgi:diamine N-acetyltransferase